MSLFLGRALLVAGVRVRLLLCRAWTGLVILVLFMSGLCDDVVAVVGRSCCAEGVAGERY